MALAIAHFAVGAMIATLVVTIVAPRSRFKGTVIVASGFWGMVPDAYLAAPNYLGWLEAIHHTSRANLFWFHHALDIADPADTTGLAARLVALWLVVTVVVELGGFLVAAIVKRARRRTGHGLDSGN